MDTTRLKQFVETFWDDSILPSITEYIRIPNKSPAFDPQWVEHGYMEEAVKLMEAWARPQLDGLAGRHAGGGPPARPHAAASSSRCRATSDDTVLLYGHLDKQPEMKGWAEGLGPWEPVLQGRQALWPRRRRRRLCDLCLPVRAAGAAASRSCRAPAAW